MTARKDTWSREQLIIAFNLYCRIPFGSLHSHNPQIVKFAKLIGRSPGALAMRLVNFASLDPYHAARGVAGLSHVSEGDRQMWKEFGQDWESLAYESQRALMKYAQGAESDSPEQVPSVRIGGRTEAVRTIRARLVQGFFRQTVLTSYESRCAMCGLELKEMLNASHIIPWSVNKQRRADPTNGLSLCAFHDRAFDRGFIGIDEKHRIMVSDEVKITTDSKMHTVGLIRLERKLLQLPNRFRPDDEALRYHRTQIFKN